MADLRDRFDMVLEALESEGEWRRIAAELSRDPWGRVARRVEEVLGFSRPYGVADAFETVLDRVRTRAEASERAEVAADIRRTIANSGLSSAEFAARVGTSASRLSTSGV